MLAVDGLEAARAIREVGADLALIDIHMPNMDGMELLITLQAIAPTMPWSSCRAAIETGGWVGSRTHH